MAKAELVHSPKKTEQAFALPEVFSDWFAEQGWAPRPHQLDLTELGLRRQSALLIAPTGGGKTLAGFLAPLVELADLPPAKPGRPRPLHTLYISPLKALAVDIQRNLERPVSEMGLSVKLESRSGDTSVHKRTRQRASPPDILLTTPEQVALLLAYKDAPRLFRGLRYVIIDELHALASTKRGHLLALGLARLRQLAPGLVATGLSATVKHPDALRAYLADQSETDAIGLAHLVRGQPGAPANVNVLASEAHIPWASHHARHAVPEVYKAIKKARIALIFVNTRSQAEMTFQELWRINEDALPIALHHGSLSAEQRRKVEAAMTRGDLRAVVCTSTLDLGIDWGDVDLVIQMGAPKGASRLLQRIGRANHRLDEPSRALLVPSNRFEALECRAAKEAVEASKLDGEPPRKGALDVLAQHILGMAVSAPIRPDDLFTEVCSAAPYAGLTRELFDRVLSFVADGGYALKTYDRFRRLVPTADGTLRISHPSVAQSYRLNVGTIIEAPKLKVRLGKPSKPAPGQAGRKGPLRGGRPLGEIEEYFIEQMSPGDTFLFSGQVLRLEGLVDTDVYVSRASDSDPKIPSYVGGKFPLSTFLAERVRDLIATPKKWPELPAPVREWLEIQRWRSVVPKPDQLLIETFPRGTRYFLTCYPFDGRLAHQTLGMLITRRLDRLKMRPMGFVANEYALQVWGLRDMSKLDMAALFDEDMMGDDLDAWLDESALLKRTFRQCAQISGLIERRFPGQEKTGRQVTFSSDLIYDVLRSHEPDHILLQATRDDAATGLLDLARLGMLLKRAQGHLLHKPLDRVSPLAVPVMLEIGREPVAGETTEFLLGHTAEELIQEATRPDE